MYTYMVKHFSIVAPSVLTNYRATLAECIFNIFMIVCFWIYLSTAAVTESELLRTGG